MRRISTLVPAALVALAIGACNDATAPLGDQAAVLAALTAQLGGMMDTTYGEAGVASNFSATSGIQSVDTVGLPRFWGRLLVIPHGPRPIFHRDVTIQGDTARVTQTVSFQGLFLQDTSTDSTFDPVSKPLNEGHTQSAVFVRDKNATYGWRAVALTVQNWQPTDTGRRTVAVTDAKLYVNGTLKLDVTTPDSLYSVDQAVPLLHVGDTVRIVAAVSNTTGTGDVPPTFVFLHVRHIDATSLAWRRVPMRDNGDGTYERTIVLRRTGFDRFGVDAIDADVFAQPTADNYRANGWGIPYRIE